LQQEAERLALGEQMGRDGITLLTAVYAPTTPVELRVLPQVEFLRRAWVGQFYQAHDQTRWRGRGNMPPGERSFTSPYDPDARLSKKRDTAWVGYTVHLTETCDADCPHLITHVETTLATQADSEVIAPIHAALATKHGLPSQHTDTPANTGMSGSAVAANPLSRLCSPPKSARCVRCASAAPPARRGGS
jgi:transposase